MDHSDIILLVSIAITVIVGVINRHKKRSQKTTVAPPSRRRLTIGEEDFQGSAPSAAPSPSSSSSYPSSPSAQRRTYTFEELFGDIIDEDDAAPVFDGDSQMEELPDEGICTVEHEPKEARSSSVAYRQKESGKAATAAAASQGGDSDGKIISSKRDLIIYSAIMEPKFEQ